MWAVQLYGRLLFPIHLSLVVNIASDLQWVIFRNIPFEKSHNAAHSSFNIDPSPITVHCCLSCLAEMITFWLLQTAGITSCRTILQKRAFCTFSREKLLILGVTWGKKTPKLFLWCLLEKNIMQQKEARVYMLSLSSMFLGTSALWSFCASLLPALIRCDKLASLRMHHPAQRLLMWAASSEKETGEVKCRIHWQNSSTIWREMGGWQRSREAPKTCISALKSNTSIPPQKMLNVHIKG